MKVSSSLLSLQQSLSDAIGACHQTARTLPGVLDKISQARERIQGAKHIGEIKAHLESELSEFHLRCALAFLLICDGDAKLLARQAIQLAGINFDETPEIVAEMIEVASRYRAVQVLKK